MIFYHLLSRLPLALLYTLSLPGYLYLYWIAGYRKAVVEQNLRGAFPDKSAIEITVLAKKFYRQLVDVALEIIRARRMSRADFLQRVSLSNPEMLREHSNGFQDSVILLSIHQGNWEWMLHGISSALDIPVDPVYKPLHNKALDRFMFEMRSQFGSRPMTMADSGRDILRRRREFRVIAMLADQSPIRGERSYWTGFMNQEAAFYPGVEVIASTTGFPVLFVQCRRLARGYYEIEFRELANPPYDREEHTILERYVRLAEEAIRAEPHSWLWSNRRWKRRRSD